MINVGSSIAGYMHVFMRKMNLYTVIIRYEQTKPTLTMIVKIVW